MKVLLVNPSLALAQIGHYDSQVEKARGIHPSLGLLYIAAIVEREGHSVRVIDTDLESDPEATLRKTIRAFQPDLMGVHVMTWTFAQAKRTACVAKEERPEMVLVAGGAGVTTDPQVFMENSDFDFAVYGEGEITTKELLEAIQAKGDVRQITGLVFRDGETIVQNPPRELIENIDEVPMPGRHLVPHDRYFDVFTIDRHFVTMIVSRGCPFNCLYCDRLNRMGSKWRVRSVDAILQEIMYVKERMGVREIMFFDDEFVVNRNHTIDLCKRLIEAKANIKWECRARVDLLDEETLKYMKEAGCYRIRYGFESGDNDILAVLRKGITVEQSLKTAEATKRAGIDIFGYFMLGVPHETEHTMQKTIDLALKIDPDFALFSKAILIPGSDLFDWAASEGLIAADYWKQYYRGEVSDTAPAISASQLPENLVDQYVKKANQMFYRRPRYMARRLMRIKSLSQLARQVRMAYCLLGAKAGAKHD